MELYDALDEMKDKAGKALAKMMNSEQHGLE